MPEPDRYPRHARPRPPEALDFGPHVLGGREPLASLVERPLGKLAVEEECDSLGEAHRGTPPRRTPLHHVWAETHLDHGRGTGAGFDTKTGYGDTTDEAISERAGAAMTLRRRDPEEARRAAARGADLG